MNWPPQLTTFKGVVEYEVTREDEEDPETVYIDYNFEEKYGRRRRYVTVYKKKSKPLARFVGTDNWSRNRNLIWPLKHNGGRALVRDLREKPEGYEDFRAVRFRKFVKGSGASACWGIRAKEDPKRLIKIGLRREEFT